MNNKVKYNFHNFAPMDRKVKNIVKYLVSLALALLLIHVCMKNVEWSEFRKALASCKWGFVILSMCIGVLACWLRALRWKMLLNPIDNSISRMTCFNAVNISYVANLLFPRLGEFARCGYITKDSKKGEDGRKLASYDKVLGTVVLERSWDALTLLTVLGLTMALTWGRFGDFFSNSIISQISGAFEIPWLMIGLAVIAVLIVGVLWYLREKLRFISKIWNFAKGIWEGVISCLKMKHSWRFILLTIGIWACYWMTASTIIWALQGIDNAVEGGQIMMHLDLVDAFFLMVVGSVSSLVPVPGGFGAYHYLLSLALSTVYGIPMATGLIFATLSHESQALIQIICGAGSYIAETFRPEK